MKEYTREQMGMNITEACERQVAMRPKKVKFGSFTYNKCARCDEEYVFEQDKYCRKCGQKVDWTDSE